MSDCLIRMKFLYQTGNFYEFEAGFYNSGYDLPVFGEGAVAAQPDLASLTAALPATLSQGTLVGGYSVPVDLRLRFIRTTPWIGDTDLIDDLLSSLDEVIGFLYTKNFRVVYSPMDSPGLPPDVQTAKDASIPIGDSSYYVPNQVEDWPTEVAGYTTEAVAFSCSQEGALLFPAWAWLYTAAPEDSMLELISGQHELQPYIDVRWWPGPVYGGMTNFWGAYDTRYPSDNFRGWQSSPENGYMGLIDVHSGISEVWAYPLTINGPAQYTYVPFLSNTRYGYAVSVQVPYSLAPAYVFPEEEQSFPYGFVPPWLSAQPLTIAGPSELEAPAVWQDLEVNDEVLQVNDENLEVLI